MSTLLQSEEYLESVRLRDVCAAAALDSKPFIAEINAFDPTTLERFHFTMYPNDEDPLWFRRDQPRGDEGWLWQAEIIDWWNDKDTRKALILKARQLGVTWLAMAQCVWYLCWRPGSHCVAYSYNEDEAKKLVARAWLMFNSLPEQLKNGVEVISPQRAEEPSEWIKVKHTLPNGSTIISSIQALPATKKAGHGDTVTFAVMDEVSRQDYAKQIYTAINPAVSRGKAKLVMISTANGVGNADTGEGNYFHILYTTKKMKGISFRFLPWNLEPTRNAAWYQMEAMALDEVERNQQYPLNENDAFMLSGALYFDSAALQYYRTNVMRPLYSAQFAQKGPRRAGLIRLRDGVLDIWEEPRANAKYAMSVDVSSGRATDFTSADVIDLESGTIVASLHGKMTSSLLVIQVHFLGKWYNTAKIAVERQGGYGEALITLLKDGTKGLPPYPNLYRHVDGVSGSRPISEQYGIPMGVKQRPLIVTGLQQWIKNQSFPWLGAGHLDELGTFVYKTTGTSPAAQDGCNDDRVLSLGIAVEMFRQFGHHPQPRAKWNSKGYQPAPTRAGG